MVTKLLTTINDREILDGQIDTFVDVSGASDRYLVESTINADVEVQDFDGGVIVLPAGLTLDDVQVAAGGSAVQITVNGSTITYTSGGAGAAFTVVLGGSNENLAAGTTVTAAEFADLFDAAGAGAVVGTDGSLGDGSVDPVPTDGLEMTTGRDVLVGTAGDDVFSAPIIQNQFGAVTNTFESGDVLDGGAGRNILEADLTAVVSGLIPIGPAISATTANIQEVYLRYQFPITDFATNENNFATIDAEKMVGVEQWWSDNSRNDIIIEDVRSAPQNTTFGFRDSDPNVSFAALFSPEALEGFVDQVNSALVITLVDVADPAQELGRIDVTSLTFNFNGVDFTVESAAITAADTYAELAAAIQAELDATPALANLVVTVDSTSLANTVVVINDPAGGVFGPGSSVAFENNTGGLVAQGVEPGLPVEVVDLITTDIVLDNVGRGSEGGAMVVGGMSTRGGVEVFNVTVGRDSWLEALDSTNDSLQVVNVTSAAGSTGYLYLGEGQESNGGLSGQQRVPTTTDNRLGFDSTTTPVFGFNTGYEAGLTNVQVFDATAFAGDLSMSASLNARIVDKYLSDVTEPVQFEYLFGDGDSSSNAEYANILHIDIDEAAGSDLDFRLSIVGGDGDDRFDFTENNETKSNISIDGGLGDNVVEVKTSTTDGNAGGGAPSTTTEAWASFTNIQTLVVAGDVGSVQEIVDGNMTSLDGGTVIVATEEMAIDTSVIQLRQDTDLSISGKNQTIGPGENNDDQTFGTVAFNVSRGIPGDNSVELLLDNTARNNGELSVENLQVTTGPGVGNILNLTSGGSRDVTNLVQSSTYAGINTLNLLGTQDLAINVSNIDGPSVVNGAALTGDLLLGMNGGLLNGNNNVITGTAGDSDLFVVYSNGAVSNVTASVSAFETVQLGLLPTQYDFLTGVAGNQEFRGVYNAANTLGAELYFIQHTAADAVSILNMDTVQSVVIDTDNNELATADVTLTADDRDLGNTLSVELANAAGFVGAWAAGMVMDDRELTIVDYRTVNLELGTGDAGFVLTLNNDMDDTYTRTLNISGGDADHSSLLGQEEASLDIGQLDTALTLVDISAYDGELVDAQWDSQLGTNAVVVANEFNFNFDLLDNTNFGQTVQLFSGQLGEDADYANNTTFSLDVDVDGTTASTAFTVAATGVKNTDLAALAVEIDGTTTAFANLLGDGDDYEIEYTASFTGGNLVVSVEVTNVTDNVVLGTDDAFIDAFDFDSDDVGVGVELDETDTLSGFISTFDFNVDAEAFGVVWEVADFNAFNVDGVSLSNVSILDLSALGITGLADIVVQDGADYLAGLNADEVAAYAAFGNPAADFMAGDAVITSNGDDAFTIHLTGVDFLDLSNENFVFAA